MKSPIPLRVAVLLVVVVALAAGLGVMGYQRFSAKPKRVVLTAASTPENPAPAEKEEAPAPETKALPPAETRDAGSEQTFAGIVFVWCPEGAYEQGLQTTPADAAKMAGGREEWYADAYPARHVEIARGFWMSKLEITRGQWATVVKPKDDGGASPEMPMTGITWDECEAFVRALNEKGEGVFSLPTEAEWEYACRAGSTSLYFFGDNPAELGTYAWTRQNAGDGNVQPVGHKKPNPWGLQDILGNAWEWCADEYGAYGAPAAAMPGCRVIRGGGATGTNAVLHCAYRQGMRHDQSNPRVGLRVKREAGG